MVLKKFSKTIIPSGTWLQLRHHYQEISWRINPLSMMSAMRIQSYKNIHRGQRCFIIGNGPSLNKMDLTLLQNEITFGMNRIYLLFPKMGFQTTYYVSVNRLVIEQFASEIMVLPMPKFLSRRGSKFIGINNQIMFMYPRAGLDFSYNPQWYIYEGTTVTYVALQLAYYMGFTQAILIGVDHNFHTKGPANLEVVSEGGDPNHFSSDYFGAGIRWQLPNLIESENAYKIAHKVYTQDNRIILDATVDGNLQVFQKVNYRNLFT